MKRAGNLIEQVSGMNNLLLAFWKAQRGKSGKQEVQAYREHLQDNLLTMRRRLLEGCVEVGHYHTFTIHDPKERKICAAAFDERVLHHALMNVCHPIFDRQLIYETYATRLGKGTYAALEYAHKAMEQYCYVAKLDVRKYFDSVEHETLKRQLLRLYKDRLLLDALFRIIDTYSSTPGRGLPIGNLTSQYFANQYLSGLDHYVKERLRTPAYVRYMDDMLLFGDDRASLISHVDAVKRYVATLDLMLKPPVVVSSTQGVSFLGYRLHGHAIGLNSRSKRRFEHRMKVYESLRADGVWSEEDYHLHITPLLAFTVHAYTKQYRRRTMAKVGDRRALTA